MYDFLLSSYLAKIADIARLLQTFLFADVLYGNRISYELYQRLLCKTLSENEELLAVNYFRKRGSIIDVWQGPK